MSALDACPPLNANVLRQTPLTTQSLPALSLPTVQALPSTAAVNHHELLRVQQLRQQEKVKMAPPQTMSPLDVSIQQKVLSLFLYPLSIMFRNALFIKQLCSNLWELLLLPTILTYCCAKI